MNWINALFLGIVIGLLLELLADYFFWSKRRVCSDNEAKLATENLELTSRLETRDDDIIDLQNENQRLAHDAARFHEVSARADEYKLALQARDEEIAELKSQRGVFGVSPQPNGNSGNGAEDATSFGSEEPTTVAEGITDRLFIGEVFDDLTRIWGIDPKVSNLLTDHGIHTFADLATTSSATLLAILTSTDHPMPLNKYKSWPAQARLASNGEWDGLELLQAELTWDEATE